MLFDTLKKAMLIGFGVQESAKKFIEDLIKKGELSEAQGSKLFKEWVGKAEEGTKNFNKTLNEFVSKTIEKMNITTRNEIEKLNKKVQALSARVRKLEGGSPEEQ